ncbi:hypothetical protein TRFO_30746 [Tritrichomonas foetus]|uniref:Chromo domain-containing protein n=1 Tax=Tritrichomonas foetus TaxID=1144522 RepID=A0A1J4JY81_9EUKA|nr:hypothetical protein TRFO_30746 [Tritrichomonas foetus]|eukprot:OHT02229.1 hypothetical protein TRFO_30746 [Tritrichomonas foetus]
MISNLNCLFIFLYFIRIFFNSLHSRMSESKDPPQQLMESEIIENNITDNSNYESQVSQNQIEHCWSGSDDEDFQIDAEKNGIEKILSHSIQNNNLNDENIKIDSIQSDFSYLVKFYNKSYHECAWMKESDILSLANGNELIQNYKNSKIIQNSQFNEDFLKVEKIIATRVEKIIATRVENNRRFYLVKWSGLDYKNNTWESEEALNSIQNSNKHVQFDKMNIADQNASQNLNQIENQGLIMNKTQNVNPILNKTSQNRKTPKNAQANIKNIQIINPPTVPNSLILEFNKNNQIPDLQKQFKHQIDYTLWNHSHEINKSSKFIPTKHQIEACDYISHSYCTNTNVIFADEPGFGRAVSCSMFLKLLSMNEGINGPFLIIASEKRIAEWKQILNDVEFGSVLTFTKPKIQRKTISEYELFYPNSLIPKPHLILSTFSINAENSVLSKISWQVVIVDIAHCENPNVLTPQFFSLLSLFQTNIFIFMINNIDYPLYQIEHNASSSTSLSDQSLSNTNENGQNDNGQNEINMNDNILNSNGKLSQIEQFDLLFKVLFKSLYPSLNSIIKKLTDVLQCALYKSILHSILLQRRLTDIDKNVNNDGKVIEYLIDCNMTEEQYGYYLCLYQKYFPLISRNSKSFKIQQVFKDLKKVCTHPYLLDGVESDILIEKNFTTGTEEITENCDSDLNLSDIVNPNLKIKQEMLISVSNKMIIIDKLIHKFHNENKRVVIFSTSDKILDLIQDYFESKNLFFERINNTIRGVERETLIHRFNMPSSLDFAFLINTKCGLDGVQLNNVHEVIIVDSDWNPNCDISKVIHIINTRTISSNPSIQSKASMNSINQIISIYRLISSKSVERLLYDRAIIKQHYPELHNLPINDEITNVLLFGVGLKECFNYSNDTTEIILSRSIKNFYNSKNFDQNYILSTLSQPISESSPWENMQFFSIKEQYQYEPNPLTSTLNVDSIDSSGGEKNLNHRWTVEKVQILILGMFRFGWGRWESIHLKCSIDAPDYELEAICYIFLNVLIQISQENHPIAQIIYNHHQLSVRAYEFLKEFQDANLDFQISNVTENVDENLNIFEMMYFINIIVLTCPDPPNQIVIPYIESPFEEWSEKTDRYLIYHVFQNGYNHFGNSNYDSKYLEFRVKCLLNTVKERFLNYRELKDPSAVFEHLTLIRSMNMLTKEEQRRYVHLLISYGWTNSNDFRTISGSYRTQQELDIIHYLINDYCKGKKEFIQELAEGIPKKIANFILYRQQLLFNVRNNINQENVLPPDWPIVSYVREFGFLNLENSPEIVNRFGTDSLEYKVTQFLINYIPKMENMKPFKNPGLSGIRSPSSLSHLSKSSITEKIHKNVSTDDLDFDEMGNPIMPITITPSLKICNLGEIVTDRPNFYNSRYIYPRNFMSMKLFKSVIDPNDKVWYQSLILDDGSDSPLFRVQLKDDPSIHFDGPAPSNAWLCVIKVINDKKKDLGLPSSKNVTVSGPEYYGLAAPIVQALIQKMKGAEFCQTRAEYTLTSSIHPSSSLTSNKTNQNCDSDSHSNTDEKKEDLNENSSDGENSEESENESDLDNGQTKRRTRRRKKKISYFESSSSSSSSDTDDPFPTKRPEEKDEEFTLNEENKESESDSTDEIPDDVESDSDQYESNSEDTHQEKKRTNNSNTSLHMTTPTQNNLINIQTINNTPRNDVYNVVEQEKENDSNCNIQ